MIKYLGGGLVVVAATITEFCFLPREEKGTDGVPYRSTRGLSNELALCASRASYLGTQVRETATGGGNILVHSH